MIKCKELPSWIISSDRAAYHPYNNVIYIKEGEGLMTLLHEFGHYIGHRLGGTNHFIHKILDGGRINFS